MGVVYDESLETGKAISAYARAVAIQERLMARRPPPKFASMRLSNYLRNLGSLKIHAGKPDEGVAEIRRAIALLDGVNRDQPGDPENRRELARCYARIVPSLINRGQNDEALAMSVQAREIYEEQHRQQPENSEIARELAIALNQESFLLRAAGRTAEALTASEAAQALYRDLVAENPRVVAYRLELASSYNIAGDLARQLGRFEALGEFGVKARDILEAVARADPRSTAHVEHLSKAYNNLGRFHASRRDRAQALAAFRHSVGLKKTLPQDDPNGQYDLACNLALAMSTMADSPATRAEREGLAAEAMGCLRNAVAGGLRNIGPLPLRRRPRPAPRSPGFPALDDGPGHARRPLRAAGLMGIAMAGAACGP